ncbi:MAG TPA: hypothetical protein VME69_13865 [Methylocella sp.]|nr:hypothetical protein [Methylocella sp.]
MESKPNIGPQALAFLAIFTVAASSEEAQAEKLWSWSYRNPDTKITAAGTLTTKDRAAGSYEITAMTGAWNGTAITGLEPAHSCCSPPGWNDNLLLDGDPSLDKSGLAFGAGNGLKVNLFYKDGRYAYEIENGPEAFGGDFAAAPMDRQ